MKNINEIKFMMERLEKPRLTETELNKRKKSLIKESDESLRKLNALLDSIENKKSIDISDIKKAIIISIESYGREYDPNMESDVDGVTHQIFGSFMDSIAHMSNFEDEIKSIIDND